MLYSECCGAPAEGFTGPHGTIDSDSTDYGICPECHEHCEFVNEDEEEIVTNKSI